MRDDESILIGAISHALRFALDLVQGTGFLGGMTEIRSICVYCGSSNGHNETFQQQAEVFGRALAEAGIRLVYGGGNRGIMGAVARAASENGGEVTGIIPQFLIEHEWHKNENLELGEVIVTENMHQRKHLMFEKSDAFVALPGGIGTLEELVEVLTWSQLGRHNKPIVMANIDQFWSPLIKLTDHMSEEGFFHSAALVRPLVIEQAKDILPAILREAERIKATVDDAIIDKL